MEPKGAQLHGKEQLHGPQGRMAPWERVALPSPKEDGSMGKSSSIESKGGSLHETLWLQRENIPLQRRYSICRLRTNDGVTCTVYPESEYAMHYELW